MVNSAQRTSSQWSVHVSGFREFYIWFNEVCVVITVAWRRDVCHISDDQNPAFYVNLCSRWGMTGHNIETFCIVQLSGNECGSCYLCKLSLYRNKLTHREGLTMNSGWYVINKLRLHILTSSATQLRAQLTDSFIEMKKGVFTPIFCSCPAERKRQQCQFCDSSANICRKSHE